jgi:SpoVK/Ycf46/Vps4 family AAA+-type ATPase
LASLVSVAYPITKLNALSLPIEISNRLLRVLKEQRHQRMIRDHGLAPRRKLLLVGPPGSGKTMTASALAGELSLPLLTILLEAVITRFMGETAVKLKLIFDAMENTRGVYLFDEFDAIGSKRTSTNDVGEIRRVLNSFLQFLEKDNSQSVIIAATNHPELLDKALFRRFDDVIEYHLPDEALSREMLSRRLAAFNCEQLEWNVVLEHTHGLSQADIARAGDDAAKEAVLQSSRKIDTTVLVEALKERRSL